MSTAKKGKSRFVSPETVRLELSEGDWIEVKSELNHGEQQKLASYLSMNADGSLAAGSSTDRYMIERKYMYLTDWSFLDDRGKSVPITRAAISNLTQDAADEIDEALNEHFNAMQAKKKSPSPAMPAA